MKKDKETGKLATKPATNLLVLNEVVVDRGPSPYLSNIDLYLDGKLITSVQGDGLIISTPTGKMNEDLLNMPDRPFQNFRASR